MNSLYLTKELVIVPKHLQIIHTFLHEQDKQTPFLFSNGMYTFHLENIGNDEPDWKHPILKRKKEW